MIELKEKRDCCGCSACVQVCPKQCVSLKEDYEGFLYPEVDKGACINCSLCEKICPVLHPDDPHMPLKVYAAKNKNEEIRLKSSSGGIFTLLAERVIYEGGVVFGARFNNKWEVIHDYTETIEGLAPFRGSKYVQSKIGDNYLKVREFLNVGRKVLFSGTPCQIAGLKRFLRKDYPNLLVVDFICHGVPSTKVWQLYLKELLSEWEDDHKNRRNDLSQESSKIEITDISFRDKTQGWQNYRFVIKGEQCDGKKISEFVFSEKFRENVYMKGFLANIYLRPSCYVCAAKSGKSGSDITIADYWGINRHNRDFNDDRGISLVLVNTQRGVDVYSKISAESIETEYSQAIAGNFSFENSVSIPKYREKFWMDSSDDFMNVVESITIKMRPGIVRRAFLLGKRIIKRIYVK